MDIARQLRLKRNSTLLFFARSFMSIKLVHSLLSLFYAANGLSDRQIVWVTLFWALTTLLFEIPSSYMADRWGRKKTLLFGTFFGVAHWIILLQAEGFWWIVASMICLGIVSASFSGTDIALIYDTKRELSKEDETLKSMGQYGSAVNFLKMFAAFIGVYLARDLTAAQFDTIIWVDIIATSMAFVLLMFVTEPNHHLDLEKKEAGIFIDAAKLLRKELGLQRAILNRVLVILVSYATWSYSHVFFTSLGITVIALGVGGSLYHLCTFIIKRHAHVIAEKFGIARAIQYTSIVWASISMALIILYYLGVSGWILYPLSLLSTLVFAVRNPLFDQLYNSFSASYNRATVLSLSNLLYNVLQFPIFLAAGFLIAYNPIYPYIFGVFVVILVVLYLPIRSESNTNA